MRPVPGGPLRAPGAGTAYRFGEADQSGGRSRGKSSWPQGFLQPSSKRSQACSGIVTMDGPTG